jgi:hypothetical protein
MTHQMSKDFGWSFFFFFEEKGWKKRKKKKVDRKKRWHLKWESIKLSHHAQVKF